MALSLTKMDDVIVCFSFDFWCRIVKGKIFYKFLEEPLIVISRLCQLMKIWTYQNIFNYLINANYLSLPDFWKSANCKVTKTKMVLECRKSN